MRKMLSLLTIMSVMLMTNCRAQSKVVGEIVNGNPVITMDKQAILKSYNENLLNASGIDGQFDDVMIRAVENNNYIMVFTGKKYRSTMTMQNNAGKLASGSTSCTTSDCSSEPNGCKVTSGSGTVYCTPCGNMGKCIWTWVVGKLVN